MSAKILQFPARREPGSLSPEITRLLKQAWLAQHEPLVREWLGLKAEMEKGAP